MLGRATVLLMLSQGFLLVSGYSINVGLARILGPPEFGTFGVVMSLLLVVQLFVITGIPIAVQKYVAENMSASVALLRKTLPWHLIYSLAVWLCFWLLTPVIAASLRDDSLNFYLRVASIDILFYGLYKYYLSMQNGLHQFGRQTLSGIAYAIAKPVATFALILLGYGVAGAIIGNTLGSIGGLAIAMAIIRFPELKSKLGSIPFFRFAFTNVFYYVGLQLLFSIDIWFVKYYMSGESVGQYVSASSIAKIPYFLSLAVSSALLPSISKATKERNEKRVQDIVRLSLRYWLILLFAMIVVVGSMASSLIVLFFGEAYADGGPILSVLFTAVALLTFAAVMNTILISRDQLSSCLMLIAVLVGVHLVANALLVPGSGGLGAAVATLIVAVFAVAGAGYLLARETKVVVPALSALKTVLAATLVFLLTWYLAPIHLYLVVKCLLVAVIFVVLLFVLRELSLTDLKRLRTIIVTSR